MLVQGPGGIGKTTLTQQAAHHPAVLARFGPRRWFAELETATDRDTFDAQLLLALGLSPTAGFAAAVERLGRAPGLLVLDNLDTPWRDAGPAIEARLGQLAAIPGLALLASFRGAEAVGGARFTLRLTVDPLAERDARALFLAIAGKDKADDPHLAALLAALGGVPLAIGLTARRAAPHRRLAELWDAWQRLGPEVAQWVGQDEGRLTSVVHSIELSRQASRMTPAAHRLFALLGQCPAGLCAADRRALLGDDALDGAEALLAVGLAILRGDDRLDLLPPVRDHARRAHPPQGDDATAWCRYFLDKARAEGERIFHDGGADALVALTPEVANIEAAILYAPEADLRAWAVTALNGAIRLQMASGLGSAHVLLTLATACADAADRQGEAECHWRAGDVLLTRSDHEAARDAYQRAATLFHDLGLTREETYCIHGLGDIALRRADHDAAKASFDDALPLFRRVGDVNGEAKCIQSLGDIALHRSDHVTAKASFEDALPLYRRVGDVNGEAYCIRGLGDIALHRADHDTAKVCFEEALSLFRRVGDLNGEAKCISHLGDIALRRSDHDNAKASFEDALPLYRRVGDVNGEANCIFSLGDIALARADHDTAKASFEEALPLYRRVGAVLGEANCIFRLGDIALARSDHDTAKARFDDALPLYRRIGDVLGEANCFLSLGRVAAALGDLPTARTQAAAALGLYERMHAMQHIAILHEDLAARTDGDARAGHVQAAITAWRSMGLEEQAQRVLRRFGTPE